MFYRIYGPEALLRNVGSIFVRFPAKLGTDRPGSGRTSGGVFVFLLVALRFCVDPGFFRDCRETSFQAIGGRFPAWGGGFRKGSIQTCAMYLFSFIQCCPTQQGPRGWPSNVSWRISYVWTRSLRLGKLRTFQDQLIALALDHWGLPPPDPRSPTAFPPGPGKSRLTGVGLRGGSPPRKVIHAEDPPNPPTTTLQDPYCSALTRGPIVLV
jgi:hypothetical protein